MREEMRYLPQSRPSAMNAVNDAMTETNRQLGAMNEQMGQVLRTSAPIQREQECALERADKFRSRLGLPEREIETAGPPKPARGHRPRATE